MSRRPAFWRPSEPAFWAFGLVVVITGVYTLSEQALFREVSASGWALAWSLALVYAAPAVLLVLTLDLFERQPASLLAAAFIWGAVPATALSSLANAGWSLALARSGGPDVAATWTATMVAPLAEETLKLCGLVLIYLIAKEAFTDLLDGFVYGAMVGLGFSVVEEVFYFMGVFGGQPSDVLRGFFLRAVASGFYGHLLYSGLAGVGLAYFVTRRGERRLLTRVAVASGLFLLAVTAHLLWNSPWLDFFPHRPWTGMDVVMLPFAVAVKGLPFLATAGVLVWLARRRERRWLETATRIEDLSTVLPARDVRVLGSPRRRRRSVREMRRRAGPAAAKVLRRLQKEQLRVAMLGSRSGERDDDELTRQMAECRALESALGAIPGATSATG